MGICSSYDSTAVATAKLILQDGRLKEFPYPVKVSYVLQRVADPATFICNSDEMDFDDVVYPVHNGDDLLPGRQYFALPISRLRRRLQPDEIAALAVKASSALMNSSGGGKCGSRRKQPPVHWLDPSPDDARELRKEAAAAATLGGGGRVDRGGSRRGSREKFTMILNAIPE